MPKPCKIRVSLNCHLASTVSLIVDWSWRKPCWYSLIVDWCWWKPCRYSLIVDWGRSKPSLHNKSARSNSEGRSARHNRHQSQPRELWQRQWRRGDSTRSPLRGYLLAEGRASEEKVLNDSSLLLSRGINICIVTLSSTSSPELYVRLWKLQQIYFCFITVKENIVRKNACLRIDHKVLKPVLWKLCSKVWWTLAKHLSFWEDPYWDGSLKTN